MSRRKGSSAKKRKPRTLKREDLQGLLERTRTVLSEQDQSTLEAVVDTLAFLTRELESKGTTIERLRRLLFGPSTEKTSGVSLR